MWKAVLAQATEHSQEVEAELRELSQECRKKYPIIKEYTDRAILKIRHHREDASNGHGSGTSSDFPLDEVLRAILMACETFHSKIVMISLSCLQRLIHREALKEETVAIVVNLMKEQAANGDETVQLKVLQTIMATPSHIKLLNETVVEQLMQLLYSLHNSSNASVHHTACAGLRQLAEHLADQAAQAATQAFRVYKSDSGIFAETTEPQMELPPAGELQNIRPSCNGDQPQKAPALSLPEFLPLGVEGELRIRLCLALATREDERIASQPRAPVSREVVCLPPQRGEWQPRWRVLRGHDALPGQDVGRPAPLSKLADAKAFCESRGLAGIVLFGGLLYLRPRGAGSQLLAAATPQSGADLLVRPADGAKDEVPEDEPRDPTMLRVAVLATQDEFDETSLFDLGMVSTTGNGRRYAAQALLRNIMSTEGLELTAVLIYDWKNNDSTDSTSWAVPIQGPERCTVALRGGKSVTAWRGSMNQLMGACAGDLEVDVAVSIQARRSCLELLRSIRAKQYVAMGHDYNLPFGPWGMEVEPQSLAVHQSLLRDERLEVFCTSRHLRDFLERFSEGTVRTRLCYCADYGYFDDTQGFVPPAYCDKGQYVTFISPCPAKGLAIVLRLALMLPGIQFLCVSTGWTKTLHEVQLKAHPNIRVVPGTDSIEDIYQQTALLLMPSLWQESFGLVAVEAQLRGIPVISTAACGLKEANFLEELQVPQVRLVHDSRTREMLRGVTMEEAELALDPLRPGHDSTKGSRWHVHVAHTIVASDAEAAGFARLPTPRNVNALGVLPESGRPLKGANRCPYSLTACWPRAIQHVQMNFHFEILRESKLIVLGCRVVPLIDTCLVSPGVAITPCAVLRGSVMRRTPAAKLPNVAPNQAPDGLRGPLRMFYIFVQDLCVMADYDVSSMSTRYSMDPSERMRTGNREGYWLANVKFPRPLCLELLGACISAHPSIFRAVPACFALLRHNVCAALLKNLRGCFDFAILIRSVQLLQQIFRPALAADMLAELQVFLHLMLDLTNAERSLWQRATSLEFLRSVCEDPMTIAVLYSSEEASPVGRSPLNEGSEKEEAPRLFLELVNALSKLMHQVCFSSGGMDSGAAPVVDFSRTPLC
ncbi:unnamed protein product [Symbiodinium natans]|uniref:Uncharacterized protein n=1 Tax=Symbiodinium natans TaxID=878477 RepID=A0A812Q2N2_9DINO|nr:unnamed protein product [Symbiodinium natans]